MTSSPRARTSIVDRFAKDRTQAAWRTRLSRDGVFANGVTAAAVTQFVLDYDETARLEHVADHFALDVEDVDAALRYYAVHGERLRATGQVVPEQ